MKNQIEPILIVMIIILMIVFLSLYFRKNKQYKKLRSAVNSKENNSHLLSALKITEELQFYEAKLDLYEQLSSVGTLVFNYEPPEFFIDKNGLMLIGGETEIISHKDFEKLVHEDDTDIYFDIFDAENIKFSKKADETFIIRIKDLKKEVYKRYLFKIKPLYNEDGDILYLLCAFIFLEEN